VRSGDSSFECNQGNSSILQLQTTKPQLHPAIGALIEFMPREHEKLSPGRRQWLVTYFKATLRLMYPE